MKGSNLSTAELAHFYGLTTRSAQRWLAYDPPAPLAHWFDMPDWYASLSCAAQQRMAPKFRAAILSLSEMKFNPIPDSSQVTLWLCAAEDAIARGKELPRAPKAIIDWLKANPDTEA
jgi:hypothetical protein